MVFKNAPKCQRTECSFFLKLTHKNHNCLSTIILNVNYLINIFWVRYLRNIISSSVLSSCALYMSYIYVHRCVFMFCIWMHVVLNICCNIYNIKGILLADIGWKLLVNDSFDLKNNSRSCVHLKSSAFSQQDYLTSD